MEIEPLRILLADDDESDRLLFTEAFADLKIKTSVITVNNGIQLMERLNMKDLRLPNLIFLDLNMPLKNGIECLKEIRSNEKLKDISIAIYSTSDNEKDLEETFINRANVYITKPAKFEKLKEVLEKAVLTAFLYKDKTMNRDNFFLKI
jgi:CheY-like chemotaxis protein